MADNKIISIPDGKICDYVDGKFRNDTPEEYVRQTIEKRLINEHKYDASQIKIEYTLQLGSRKPRADIVIFKKDCTEQKQENVYIIIECKKETVDARNAKDGVEQLKSYMSACPNCEWGMWTNGKQKEVFKNTLMIRVRLTSWIITIFLLLTETSTISTVQSVLLSKTLTMTICFLYSKPVITIFM